MSIHEIKDFKKSEQCDRHGIYEDRCQLLSKKDEFLLNVYDEKGGIVIYRKTELSTLVAQVYLKKKNFRGNS